jgi:hypothetical protein
VTERIIPGPEIEPTAAGDRNIFNNEGYLSKIALF